MTLDEFLLSLVVWREARSEPYDGKLAVAHVVLTRARNPRWWGSDIYTVITKPLQFSSMTDPHDTQTGIFPNLGAPLFLESLAAAQSAMSGLDPNPVPTADHYFADYIAPPQWAEKGTFLAQIGRHKFYSMEGVS